MEVVEPMNWPEPLGPMPEAVRDWEDECRRHRENRKLRKTRPDDFLRGVDQGFAYFVSLADAAVAALTTKLARSIEWGRIEQKRKQEAEGREHDAIVRAERAEARTKALECCGNCGHWGYEMPRGHEYMHCAFNPNDDSSVDPPDPCHFTPSRWEGGAG